MLADTVSAVVVLAAFGAGFRYLAGRAFGRAPGLPRLRLPGRRGAITLSLSRAVARVVVLAARFASGAPLGRRRTDATFLSAGTRTLAGVPGWFTTAEPGWWAFWPGWKRAAGRRSRSRPGWTPARWSPGPCWAGWPCWPGSR